MQIRKIGKERERGSEQACCVKPTPRARWIEKTTTTTTMTTTGEKKHQNLLAQPNFEEKITNKSVQFLTNIISQWIDKGLSVYWQRSVRRQTKTVYGKEFDLFIERLYISFARHRNAIETPKKRWMDEKGNEITWWIELDSSIDLVLFTSFPRLFVTLVFQFVILSLWFSPSHIFRRRREREREKLGSIDFHDLFYYIFFSRDISDVE